MIVDVEQIDPFSLPSVEFEQRKQLPESGGVYFAISGTEILYIGKAVNLQVRWLQHHRIDQLKSLDNVIIAWLLLNDPDEDLEELEARCIKHFSPTLNRSGPKRIARQTKKRIFRLPDDLEAEIKRLAKLHDRSENSEIIVAIRQYISRCADVEASERENDLSPDELAAECAVLHPGLTHEEYEASKKGS